ncbi:hypothetical protein PSCICM_05950 [Pseudomonas cichorii]|uniref:Uncharacterized protein n=1 Tax=Pseudomonas cichorii TaxID=36746 RepID=A0ABQ1DUS4_PSECI|nr:hypothetical protein PSCICM_05950 [Pseudomonas cichorii]GFM94770.1 hypothetical protein PSCICP_47420 [Pseudomonas cichorii]
MAVPMKLAVATRVGELVGGVWVSSFSLRVAVLVMRISLTVILPAVRGAQRQMFILVIVGAALIRLARLGWRAMAALVDGSVS